MFVPSLRDRLSSRLQRRLRASDLPQPDEGFTTIELLVVIVMFGILTAIATPSWLSFVNRQRVSASTDAALQIIRQAQSRSTTENRIWEASFRVNPDSGALEGMAHPQGGAGSWEALAPEAGDRVEISANNSDLSNASCEVGDYCVRFADRGVVAQDWLEAQGSDSEDTLGRLTLISADGGEDGPKRCAIVATLLGNIRMARGEDCNS